EHQPAPAVRERHLGTLRRREHALALPQAGVADLLEFRLDHGLHLFEHWTASSAAACRGRALGCASASGIDQLFSPHGTSTTLPARPSRKSPIASSKRSMGITCVIDGLRSSRPEPRSWSIWYHV